MGSEFYYSLLNKTFGCFIQAHEKISSNIFNDSISNILPFGIVFICGVYKSGTSLAAKIFEESFYFNPYLLTNLSERGYSSNMERYNTRECRLLRKINEGLLIRKEKYDKFLSLSSFYYHTFRLKNSKLFCSPYEYLNNWPIPIVLKDPRFVYTLISWIQASINLRRNVYVLFTRRDYSQLQEAWGIGPYTRKLLNNGSLEQMLRFQELNIEFCKQFSIPFGVSTIEELREFDKRLNITI